MSSERTERHRRCLVSRSNSRNRAVSNDAVNDAPSRARGGVTNVVAPCRMLGGAVRPNIDDLVENSYETLE